MSRSIIRLLLLLINNLRSFPPPPVWIDDLRSSTNWQGYVTPASSSSTIAPTELCPWDLRSKINSIKFNSHQANKQNPPPHFSANSRSAFHTACTWRVEWTSSSWPCFASVPRRRAQSSPVPRTFRPDTRPSKRHFQYCSTILHWARNCSPKHRCAMPASPCSLASSIPGWECYSPNQSE